MNYQSYAAYKNHEVPWLPQLPEHWSVSRGKVLFADRREAAHEGDEQLSATQQYGVIPQSSFMEQQGQKVTLAIAGTSNFRHVHKGDFVISLRSFQGGIEECHYDGCVSPAYTVLSPKTNIINGYFKYLFKSSIFISYINIFSDGIRDGKTINYGDFAGIWLPVPALHEQTQIARFLDHQTARIDALIAEQQRLIELLKEKRQAVISHAVTKGLDPDVAMKDSGVEWLGEVPENWSVGSLGYYSQIVTGATPDRSNPAYWDGDIPWIKTTEVNYDLITEAEEHISLEGIKASAVRMADAGTLLMAMYGQGVTRGRVAVLGIRAAYNQACAAISPRKDLDVYFLRWYMTAAYPYIREHGNETSQMNLSSSYINKIPVAVPPSREEQKRISQHLDKEMEKYASLIGEAERSVCLLRERRTALISAAVTGEIDVRDWEPPVSETFPSSTTREEAPA